MTEIVDAESAAPASSMVALALRKKIGWLCQLIRFAALVWSGWILYLVVDFWGDRAKAVATYANAFGFDPAPVPDLNYYVSFALDLTAWAATAFLALALWRLFSRYLRGDIFTVAAALDLRRLAGVGAAALVVSVAARPIAFNLMIAGHDVGGRHPPFVQPNDLLDAIFVTFLFSLAYIFKTAAELAEDHAQIV